MVVIIIPTYNESHNIRKLIEQISKLIKDSMIVVVDDNSPDGTNTIVHSIMKNNSRVKLIIRKEKSGRGAAVIEGFRYALKHTSGDTIIEMDADFSHDPNELPHLLRAAKKADMVIASRYISRSKIVNWPISRKMFSRLANASARLLLKVPITDYTNGYRCYRRSALAQIDLANIKTTGFFTLSEIAYYFHLKKFRFAEIPSIFRNRKRDKSNFNLKEVIEAFRGLLNLRFKVI